MPWMTLEELAALSEEQVKAELAKRGVGDDGSAAAQRERLYDSFRYAEPSCSRDPFGMATVQEETPSQLNQSFNIPTGIGHITEHLPAPTDHSSPRGIESRFQTSVSAIYDVLRRSNLSFAGEKGEEVEMFLSRIRDARLLAEVSDTELLNCLPPFLTGMAYHWFRMERSGWDTWERCEAAFRSRFADPDLQFYLREAISERVQGPHESVKDFLTCMRGLMIRVDPPMSVEDRLDRVHRNLHPRLQVAILRAEVTSLEELERDATRLERSYRAAETYRAPLPPESSLFPEFAYREHSYTESRAPNKQQRRF